MSTDTNPNVSPILIEGYASLFGVGDLSGDVVRAGAFAQSLKTGKPPAMLLQHKQGAVIGRWTRIVEDARGLYVRGLVINPVAHTAIAQGLRGLSIGFRPKIWRPRTPGGRKLDMLDLVEVSLVRNPMLPEARFSTLGNSHIRAA